MSHYIVAAGPYAKACARLAASGFQLHWQSAPAGERAKMKRASKTKFTCPECAKRSAKPDALLLCGVCLAEHKQLQVMLAELGTAA
jgi:hypothetical protein